MNMLTEWMVSYAADDHELAVVEPDGAVAAGRVGDIRHGRDVVQPRLQIVGVSVGWKKVNVFTYLNEETLAEVLSLMYSMSFWQKLR